MVFVHFDEAQHHKFHHIGHCFTEGQDEHKYPLAKLYLLSNKQVMFEEPSVSVCTPAHGSWEFDGDYLVATFSWKGNTENMKEHVFEAVNVGNEDAYKRVGVQLDKGYMLLPWSSD